MNFYEDYKYLIVPFLVWLSIQVFKFVWDWARTKKVDFKRLLGAGGMPSSHSATVITLTTMIGKTAGITSQIFAVSIIFSLIVMYDATGVRRETGKQARLLNEIVNTPGLTGVQVREKLVEAVGHTPIQVFVGAFIGVVIGLLA